MEPETLARNFVHFLPLLHSKRCCFLNTQLGKVARFRGLAFSSLSCQVEEAGWETLEQVKENLERYLSTFRHLYSRAQVLVNRRQPRAKDFWFRGNKSVNNAARIVQQQYEPRAAKQRSSNEAKLAAEFYQHCFKRNGKRHYSIMCDEHVYIPLPLLARILANLIPSLHNPIYEPTQASIPARSARPRQAQTIGHVEEDVDIGINATKHLLTRSLCKDRHIR